MASDDDPMDWLEDYYDGDVPTIEEDPSGPIAIDSLSFDDSKLDDVDRISSEDIEFDLDIQLVQRAAAETTEYVLSEAGVRLDREVVDRDAVRDLLYELEGNGYGQDGLIVAAGDRIVQQWRDGGSLADMTVLGIQIQTDETLPNNAVLAVHPDATVPNVVAATMRPWLVADPDGVGVLREVSGGA